MNKYNTILRECNYTNLKRHLFVNDFLNLSFLIRGSWYSCPLFLRILDRSAGSISLKRMVFCGDHLVEQIAIFLFN